MKSKLRYGAMLALLCSLMFSTGCDSPLLDLVLGDKTTTTTDDHSTTQHSDTNSHNTTTEASK